MVAVLLTVEAAELKRGLRAVRFMGGRVAAGGAGVVGGSLAGAGSGADVGGGSDDSVRDGGSMTMRGGFFLLR